MLYEEVLKANPRDPLVCYCVAGDGVNFAECS